MVAILKRNIPDITQIILWVLWSAFSLPGSSLTQLCLHPPVMDSTSSLSSYMWSCFWQGKISPCIPETPFLFCFCTFSPPFLLQSYFKLFLLPPLISLFLKHFLLLLLFWILHSSKAPVFAVILQFARQIFWELFLHEQITIYSDILSPPVVFWLGIGSELPPWVRKRECNMLFYSIFFLQKREVELFWKSAQTYQLLLNYS